jgi:hypothetical protein
LIVGAICIPALIIEPYKLATFSFVASQSPATTLTISGRRLNLSPGLMRSGEYAIKKSCPCLNEEASSSAGTQTSSVAPGYTVDSNTTPTFSKELINRSEGWGFGLMRALDQEVSHVISFDERRVDTSNTPGNKYEDNLTLLFDDDQNLAQVSDKYEDRTKIPSKNYTFHVPSLDDAFIIYDFTDKNDEYFISGRDVQYRLIALDSVIKTTSRDLINNKDINLSLMKMNIDYNDTHYGAVFKLSDVVNTSSSQTVYRFRMEMNLDRGIVRSYLEAHY